MVTVVKSTTVGVETVLTYVGKSTDEKPISTNGSKFEEMDTGKEYFFDGDEQGWSLQSDKYLDSIAIETPPTKTSYYVGDKFDASGAVVKAFYTDRSNANVENFTVDAPETLNMDSIVNLVYVENGRTRKAQVAIEIKSNEATDAESFIDIMTQGSAIVLGADIEVEQRFNLSHDFIMDLNGHSLVNNMETTEKMDYVFTVDGCKLTLKGEGELSATMPKIRIANAINGGEIIIESGTYASNVDIGFTATGEDSKVIFNGGEIYAVEGGIMAFSGATLELNNGKIIVTDNFPIGTNGSSGQGNNTIIVNGGYYEGHITSPKFEAIGVYIANNDTFIMNGGEIKAYNGAGILMRGGNVTLNNGKITATGVEGGGGFIGDQKTKMSQSAIIYDEKSKYPGSKGMNLTINGGVYVGFDKSLDVQSTEETPKITINGGAFIPTIG